MHPSTDFLCERALDRIGTFITVAAARHAREIEMTHAKSMNALLRHDSPFAVRGPFGEVVYVTTRGAVAALAASAPTQLSL